MVWASLIVAAAGLFWYGYRYPYRRRWLLPRRVLPELATTPAVDRQHRHLAAGGMVGENAVAATAAHFDELFRAGRVAEIERELRPGTSFAVQVRALTAIGTLDAGRVLERQLTHRLARDPVEQMWYWADVVSGLRHLQYLPALPAVLRCADAAAGSPAGAIIAAEAVAFPNFVSVLSDPTSPLGHAALRAITAVARSCRDGAIEPAAVLRGGLEDPLATLAETAPELPDPWLTAAILEAERISRRARHWAQLLAPEDRALAERLHERLSYSTTRRGDWLAGAATRLLARFESARPEEQTAILQVAYELRADVTRLFVQLPSTRAVWWRDAIRAMTWSRSPPAGPRLAMEASRLLNSRRGHERAAAVLLALAGHPCPEAEQALLCAGACADVAVQRSVASALGWWSPFDSEVVLKELRTWRCDPGSPARPAAVAALARLGDRGALAEVRAALVAEDAGVRAAAAARVAEEQLSWLWPDLQQLVETADPPTALVAAEAVERLREHVLGPLA